MYNSIINWAIIAESSLMHTGNDQIQTANPCFPSASC